MFCSSCGQQIPDSAKFCPSCGAATGAAPPGELTGSSVPARGPTPLTKTFRVTDIEKYKGIISFTKIWLGQEGYEVEDSFDSNETHLIQIRARGQWKRLVGLSTALAIKTTFSNLEMTVEIGQGHWGSKIASGAVSMFVLWPLAVTTAYGSIKQYQLPAKILSHIELIANEKFGV
jgi:hypothetical protein